MVFVVSFVEGECFYEVTFKYNLLILLLPEKEHNENYFGVVVHENPDYGLVTLFLEKTLPDINMEFFSNIT
ncbi:hypothetical protein [Methanococcus vannielii]|uniref:hypothetical protein n=1 Tax=Methanococcus vannielii TaxID=2187 RepID=UPI0003239031|nr:hypothetical protein [Methanococcus vannielii]